MEDEIMTKPISNANFSSEFTKTLSIKERDTMREFFKSTIEARTAIVTFTKLNGEERVLRCTRDLKRIPEKKHPKGIRKPADTVVTAYDIDKEDWRSFRLDSVKSFYFA